MEEDGFLVTQQHTYTRTHVRRMTIEGGKNKE